MSVVTEQDERRAGLRPWLRIAALPLLLPFVSLFHPVVVHRDGWQRRNGSERRHPHQD